MNLKKTSSIWYIQIEIELNPSGMECSLIYNLRLVTNQIWIFDVSPLTDG